MFNLNEYFKTIPLKTNNRFIIIHGDSKVTIASGNPVKENQDYSDWFLNNDTDLHAFDDRYMPADIRGIFKIQWNNEVKPYVRSIGYCNTTGNTAIDSDLCQQYLNDVIPEIVATVRKELPVEHNTYYSIISAPASDTQHTPAMFHVFQGEVETVVRDNVIAIMGTKDSFSIGTVANDIFTAPYLDIVCDYSLIIANSYTLVEDNTTVI